MYPPSTDDKSGGDQNHNRQVCVVTGSSGSLGSSIVQRLTQAGWLVVGVDVRPSDSQGRRDPEIIGDVATPEVHQQALDAAAILGTLRGWVNCAGYNILGTVADISEVDLRRGVDVNLLGTFFGTAAAVRGFLQTPAAQRVGSIVNISSIQASVGFPGFSAYAMTKGGIESLTRQVAAEYITQSIRCNAVAPGLIESGMNEALLAESDDAASRLEAWRQITPMGRWGTPDDVASAVLFLLGSESSYITGEVVSVNGGALTIAPGQLKP